MADLKISALTGASTPLAGTEVLPIVQSGATKKVPVADLTAGRPVAMAGGSFTDNITQSTAGKGVNFTANTPAAGMTSQLLNWYEEGTWTPTYTPATGSFTSITYGFNTGQYTRIGSLVYVSWRMRTSALTVGSASGNVSISGLPFAVSSTSVEFALGVGADFGVNNAGSGRANASTSTIQLLQSLNNTTIVVTDLSTGGANNFTAGFVCYRVA